ncbi:MAG TPA: hypothetical protein PK244_10090 [Pseudomonadales bacterium]|nr:hypothetical protein [Pseudomonadales bacterium]
MKKSLSKNSLLAAVTVAGFVSAPLLNASSNPFSNTELASGFNFHGHPDLKAGGSEEKCGEGSAKACTEGKCGEDKKACVEGKCGEGQCGAQCDGGKSEKPKTEAPKGHDDKAAEGKCGEGKCGEGMMN